MHKKRILVGIGFVGCYSYVCKNTVNYKSESIRLAVAGSLANMICEVAFHIIDTINVREKVADNIDKAHTNNKIN
jgi:hypothetical protein